jgi:hypothetical protein
MSIKNKLKYFEGRVWQHTVEKNEVTENNPTKSEPIPIPTASDIPTSRPRKRVIKI